MAERKETPDVLGELLSGAPTPAEPTLPAPAARPARPRAARSQPAPAPTEAPTPAAPPTPTRREYLLVGFYNYRGWRLRTVSDEQVAGWKRGPLMTEYLAQMSEEGWEVAGFANGENDYLLALLRK